jgi:hypothetical protein
MLNYSDTEWPPRRASAPEPFGPPFPGLQVQPDQEPDSDEGRNATPKEDAFFIFLVIAAFGVLGYILWLLVSTVRVA